MLYLRQVLTLIGLCPMLFGCRYQSQEQFLWFADNTGEASTTMGRRSLRQIFTAL